MLHFFSEQLWLHISQVILHQFQKVRTVLKSSDSEFFKTVLTFWNWWSITWDICIQSCSEKKCNIYCSGHCTMVQYQVGLLIVDILRTRTNTNIVSKNSRRPKTRTIIQVSIRIPVPVPGLVIFGQSQIYDD